MSEAADHRDVRQLVSMTYVQNCRQRPSRLLRLNVRVEDVQGGSLLKGCLVPLVLHVYLLCSMRLHADRQRGRRGLDFRHGAGSGSAEARQ